MKTALKVISILVAIGAFIIGAALFLFWFAWTSTLQKLDSPDQRHTAKLVRIDGIDRNYRIDLDGVRVYDSPDFAPRRDFPFREAIYFTPDSRFLVFVVGGHRIVGIDTTSRQRLPDAELLALPALSSPKLSDYGFEAEWPGIGRDREVEAAD